jgi:hypothetical protein
VNIKNSQAQAEKYILEAAKSYTQISDDGNGNEIIEKEILGGVGYNNSSLYGWLSSPDYGYVPPPGIISADVKSLNQGSLREATVKIICHSPQQFKIIDELYLKLKYTMLLEWGHTVYFNNDGSIGTSFPTKVVNAFINNGVKGSKTYKEFLDLIDKKRKEYSGNYDAFLGQVKNFDWTLRNDGGYDITLSLISMGDIIESLKVNTNYPSSTSNQNITLAEDNQDPPVQPAFIEDKEVSTLNQILYGLRWSLAHQSNGPLDFLNNKVVIDAVKTFSKYDLKENFKTEEEKNNPSTQSSEFGGFEARSVYFQNIGIGLDGKPQGDYLYFIKLGALLRIIQNFVLKYNTSQGVSPGDGEGYEPLFRIDYNFNTNLCLTLSLQCSLDPRVCMLKPKNSQPAPTTTYGQLGDNNMFRASNNDHIGKFMHIHVNFDYIAEVLRQNTDSEGRVSLYSFLSQLMDGINKSLGSINNFEVTYDESVNQLVIRDMKAIPGSVEYLGRSNIITRFNTHLLKPTEGSFVHETGLKTELNNMFASMISIGAQIDGNQTGENSTALSQLNNGYIDRLFPVKSTKIDDENKNKRWQDIWSGHIRRWKNSNADIVGGGITVPQIEENKSLFTDFYLYILGDKTNKKEIPGVTLIPLSLNLKMDGLSGMKPLQTYIIDDTLLPPLYKNQVEFLLTEISHYISDKDGWTTTVSSIGMPKREGIIYASGPDDIDAQQPQQPQQPPAQQPQRPPVPQGQQIRADVWSAEPDFWVLKENGANKDLRTVGSGLTLNRNTGLGNTMSQSKINQYKNTYKNKNLVYWAVYNINDSTLLGSHNGNTNVYGASVSKAVVVGAGFYNNGGKYTNNSDYAGATRLLIPSDNSKWDRQTALAGGDSAVNAFSDNRGYNNMIPARRPNKINAIGMCYFWNDVLRGNFPGAEPVFKITSSVSTANGRSRKYLPSSSYMGSKTGTWSQWHHDSAWIEYNGKWYTITVLTADSSNSEEVAVLFGGLFKEYVQQIQL